MIKGSRTNKGYIKITNECYGDQFIIKEGDNGGISITANQKVIINKMMERSIFICSNYIDDEKDNLNLDDDSIKKMMSGDLDKISKIRLIEENSKLKKLNKNLRDENSDIYRENKRMKSDIEGLLREHRENGKHMFNYIVSGDLKMLLRKILSDDILILSEKIEQDGIVGSDGIASVSKSELLNEIKKW